MKLSQAIVTLTLFALAPVAYSQTHPASKTTASGVLGYLDVKTGAFRPLRQESPDASAVPNIAATTGKFVFTYSIAIQSTIPTAQSISCETTVSVIEINSQTGAFRSFSESGIVTAARSGNTATCTATIPYSWALATPSSDTVTLSVGAFSESTAAPLTERMTNQDLPAIKVPANGTTTTQAVPVTL